MRSSQLLLGRPSCVSGINLAVCQQWSFFAGGRQFFGQSCCLMNEWSERVARPQEGASKHSFFKVPRIFPLLILLSLWSASATGLPLTMHVSRSIDTMNIALRMLSSEPCFWTGKRSQGNIAVCGERLVSF